MGDDPAERRLVAGAARRPGASGAGTAIHWQWPWRRPATNTIRFWRSVRPETTETAGEAIGLSLVYSGNFLAEAEVDLYGTTRSRSGSTRQHLLGPRA